MVDHLACVRIQAQHSDSHYVHIAVTPLAHGGDMLQRLIECGRMGDTAARCIMQQLMSALAHLHHIDIVHGDVKPDNILLMSWDPSSPDYNRIKLTDFGLSQAVPGARDDLVLTSLSGTPEFSAPEMMCIARYGNIRGVAETSRYFGKSAYSCKVDNWAAGCVLYTMISATTPFRPVPNMCLMVDRIIRGSFDFAPTNIWSDASADLIRQLLRVDPEERPSALQALAHPALAGSDLACRTDAPVHLAMSAAASVTSSCAYAHHTSSEVPIAAESQTDSSRNLLALSDAMSSSSTPVLSSGGSALLSVGQVRITNGELLPWGEGFGVGTRNDDPWHTVGCSGKDEDALGVGHAWPAHEGARGIILPLG